MISQAEIVYNQIRCNLHRVSHSKNLIFASRVSSKIEEGDIRGAVRIASSSDTLAPYDDVTVAALHQLHPSRNYLFDQDISLTGRTSTGTISEPDHSPLPLKVSSSDIVDAIKSFPAGSSCGLDGLKPQHLKDMTGQSSGVVGQRLISELSEFTNLCLSGDIPEIISPVFFGATLCALSKKNGGIRHIAVGGTIRRLVAKTACRIMCDRAVSKLAPTQLGFGVQHGAEAAVHAARTYLQDLAPGRAILKIDFSNAFNSLRRDVILQSIQNELPEL